MSYLPPIPCPEQASWWQTLGTPNFDCRQVSGVSRSRLSCLEAYPEDQSPLLPPPCGTYRLTLHHVLYISLPDCGFDVKMPLR